MYGVISAIAICFLVFMFWIIYLANSGGSSVFFEFVGSIPHGDKIGHLCLFGVLTLLIVIASKFRTFSFGRLNIYFGAVLVFLFAVVEEISQAFIPSRTFDFVDLAADSLGIILAVSIAFVLCKYLEKSTIQEHFRK